MLKTQGGRCAICPKKVSLDGKALSVDHCHTSGKIRGLLCSECNRGIGYFTDNPELLEAAAAYLKKTG